VTVRISNVLRRMTLLAEQQEYAVDFHGNNVFVDFNVEPRD